MTVPARDSVRSPGYFIRRELEDCGWTQKDLAFVLDMDETAVSRLIKGKYKISTKLAKSLADAFDKSPDFFAKRQAAYDVARIRASDELVARRAKLQRAFPIREMIKRRWLVNSGIESVEGQLVSLLGATEAADLRSANSLNPYLPKSSSTAEIAWFCRALQLSRTISAPDYSEGALRAAVKKELPRLLDDVNHVRRVPDILNRCGVRFLLVEELRDRIDACVFWLSPSAPVICLSLRRDHIERFWFMLRREIEHVLGGHGLPEPVLDVEVDKPSALRSRSRLNNIAGDFCVPRKKLAAFTAGRESSVAIEDVVSFAHTVGIHPGIVAGRLRARGYSINRSRHDARVKNRLLEVAVHDGWMEFAFTTRQEQRRAALRHRLPPSWRRDRTKSLTGSDL